MSRTAYKFKKLISSSLVNLSVYKTLLRTLLLFLYLGLALSACQKNASSEEFGKLIANLKDMQGNPVLFAGPEDQKLLVHFWATWCKPCLEELPALLRAKETLEKKKFRILLVSEESVEEINSYLKKKEINLESVRYNGALTDLKIHALPATFVFNEKGEKIFRKSGRIDWDSEEEIQQILNPHK